MIKLKRAYDPLTASDGVRYLVERLWPRGIKKSNLQLDGWMKDVAPSTELRKWFAHDPSRWTEFQRRYFTELENHADALQSIVDAARHGTVSLIYSSHDAQHNNAVALKRYIEQGRQRSAEREAHKRVA